jgi:outer membrane receptor for ferrienterochelin and colicins
MLKKTIFPILLILYSLSLKSQEQPVEYLFKITGYAIDSIENIPIGFLNISFLNAEDSSYVTSCLTNKDGKFFSDNLNKGDYVIRIIGFANIPVYKKMKIRKDSTFTIYINKPDAEIEEVVITGEKELYKMEPDKRVYLTENDESIQNAFAEDAIENAPGVFLDVNGNVTVRGQNAEVWINDRPSKREADNLRSYLKLLPANRIEKIEVITNPSAKYSATNTNSIVNIKLKKKSADNNIFAVGTVVNTTGIFGLWPTFYITKKKFDYNLYTLFSTGTRKSIFNDRSWLSADTDTTFYSEYSGENTDLFIDFKIFNELTYHINNKTDLKCIAIYENLGISEDNRMEDIRRFENPEHLISNYLKDESYHPFSVNINMNHNFNDEVII